MRNILILAILLCGCNPEPDTKLLQISPSGRFKVTRVGIIDDNLAYNNRRGIYIIEDTLTKKELVGISGIGISEVGSHPTGKSSIEDEK